MGQLGAMNQVSLSNKLKQQPQGMQKDIPRMTRKDFLQLLKDLPPEQPVRTTVLGSLG